MDRARRGLAVAAIRIARGAALVGLVLAVASCSGPGGAGAQKSPDGKMVMSWVGSGARLCVTDTAATCPVEKDGKVSGGQAFWVLDATCFNAGAGFGSPVEYGVVPECAKDVTVDHGGVAGGAPLVLGTTYKITVTGFGGAPTTQNVLWN